MTILVVIFFNVIFILVNFCFSLLKFSIATLIHLSYSLPVLIQMYENEGHDYSEVRECKLISMCNENFPFMNIFIYIFSFCVNALGHLRDFFA